MFEFLLVEIGSNFHFVIIINVLSLFFFTYILVSTFFKSSKTPINAIRTSLKRSQRSASMQKELRSDMAMLDNVIMKK